VLGHEFCSTPAEPARVASFARSVFSILVRVSWSYFYSRWF
jgi:hypothetical protein